MVTALETMSARVQHRVMTISIQHISKGTSHPARRLLPWHVRAGAKLGAMIERAVESQSLRDFLLAYCACFIAVSLFVW